MDEITEVKRIWESMEARLASMSGNITRDYTVYCHGTDMGKTVNIDSDQDSDDIINLLIDDLKEENKQELLKMGFTEDEINESLNNAEEVD